MKSIHSLEMFNTLLKSNVGKIAVCTLDYVVDKIKFEKANIFFYFFIELQENVKRINCWFECLL